MSDYASQQKSPRRRLIGLGLMLVFHALLFYAINTGLARKFVKVIQGPVEAKLIEEAKPDLPVPPPPPPPVKAPPPPPPAYVPPVDVPQTTAPSAVNAIAAVTTAPTPVQPPPAPPAPPPPVPVLASPPPPPPPPPPMVRLAPTRNDASSCTKPEYPAAARRAEEEGTVQLRFLIDIDGKVIQSQIEKTSGSVRLDEAARNALSRCLFRPGTLDAKPEQSWANVRYTWRLE